MNVLIACEESQAVCIEFRKRGHIAFSSDIQKCSGGHPEWHIVGSCFDVINGGMFVTESGELIEIKKWDMLIGHPPCTYLSFVGERWFDYKYFPKNLDSWIKRFEAAEFFVEMWNCGIEKICLENPMGWINAILPHTQIIHPYYFGDECSKRTCLWVKGLPPLLHTKIEGNLFGDEKTHVFKGEMSKNGSGSEALFGLHTLALSQQERSKLRSKTFPGIAKSMAYQWG